MKIFFATILSLMTFSQIVFAQDLSEDQVRRRLQCYEQNAVEALKAQEGLSEYLGDMVQAVKEKGSCSYTTRRVSNKFYMQANVEIFTQYHPAKPNYLRWQELRDVSVEMKARLAECLQPVQ